MALYIPGGGVAGISGKIGSWVFGHGKSGSTIRSIGIATNPNTILQVAVRAILAFVSQLWKTGTTAAQKAEWRTYAANVVVKNRVGMDIHVSGYNMFVAGNAAAKNAGFDEILNGPSDFTLPEQDPTLATVISQATQDIAVTFDDTLPWVNLPNNGLLIYMGIPQDDSIESFNGPWRYAGVIEGDATTAPVTGATVPVPFPVTAGQKIFTKARRLDADGTISNPFRTETIAGA